MRNSSSPRSCLSAIQVVECGNSLSFFFRERDFFVLFLILKLLLSDWETLYSVFIFRYQHWYLSGAEVQEALHPLAIDSRLGKQLNTPPLDALKHNGSPVKTSDKVGNNQNWLLLIAKIKIANFVPTTDSHVKTYKFWK